MHVKRKKYFFNISPTRDAVNLSISIFIRKPSLPVKLPTIIESLRPNVNMDGLWRKVSFSEINDFIG